MKFLIGSRPGLVQVSRPIGQLNAGLASAGGVADVVAVAPAAALEGVVEPEPVADLVRRGVALAVDAGVAAGQRLDRG